MTGDLALGGGKPGDSSGRKTITADRFWSEVGANGQISAFASSAIPDRRRRHRRTAERDLVAHTLPRRPGQQQVTDMKAGRHV